MVNRLGPLEATGLYLLVFAFCLFFFVAGVLVGRWIPPTAASPQSAVAANLEEDPPEEDLGFYRELGGSGGNSDSEAPDRGEEDVPDTQETTSEIPPPARSPQPALDPIPESGAFFTVQVGALENRRTVNQMVMRLTAKGYPSRVVEPGELENQAYLVWVESCETRSEAEELEARLRADGFPTYIKQIAGSVQP